MKRLTTLAAIAATTASLAACGGASQLDIHDQMRVADAYVALSTYCLHETEGGINIPMSELAARDNAVTTLTTILQAHPNDVYPPDHATMRQSIARERNDLSGCDDADAAKLDTLLLAES